MSQLSTVDGLNSNGNIHISNLQEGKIVKGKVVRVTKTEVFVDIGYKSEGIIPISEFTSLAGEINVKIDDEVSVYLERKEDKNGLIVISKKVADDDLSWDLIEKTFENKEVIQGKVIKKINGGLLVDIGREAFLPVSQVDIKQKPNLDEYVSKILSFFILKIDKNRKNVVLSHKLFLTGQRDKQINELWKNIKEGEIKEGVVKNIVSYGAFIDIGGVDGLLHITDISWGRISHPAEVMAVGDKIEVIILKVDKENKKISLGLKQKTLDPWHNIEEKYPVGLKVQGKVVNLVNYGAFVKLEEGIEGLLHISEISWTKTPKHPSAFLAIGDNIEAVVLNIDKQNKRFALGMKQLEQNPWDLVEENYKIGDKVKGSVSGFNEFGVFIEIPDGIESFLHVSDISWIKKIKNPSEALKKGEKIEVIILDIDIKNKKMSVGLKQLTEDPWLNVKTKFNLDTIISGRITKVLKFGIFVELEGGVEGLLHKSEMENSPNEDLENIFKIGDEIKAKIIKIDDKERRIGLSTKSLSIKEEVQNNG